MPELPLKNYHGKTCFVNAVVQVLVHNPYLREQGKEHLGQLCQCRSCLLCYLGYCVHSAYGNTTQTKLALPAWMIQHGFQKLAAGSEYQQALSPERQVIILFVCQFCKTERRTS
jgi:thiosulfate reductase cytochrome b subunit